MTKKMKEITIKVFNIDDATRRQDGELALWH